MRSKVDDVDLVGDVPPIAKKFLDNEGVSTTILDKSDPRRDATKLRRFKSDAPKLAEQSKHKKQLNQYEELKARFLSDPAKYKEYKGLKYKGHKYYLGDGLFILNEEDASNDFIGKLLKIYRYDEPDRILVFIEVQW